MAGPLCEDRASSSRSPFFRTLAVEAHAATYRHRGTRLFAQRGALLFEGREPCELRFLIVDFSAQLGDLPFRDLALARDLLPSMADLLEPPLRLGFVALLLRDARRSRKDARRAEIGVDQFQSVIRQLILADLVRVAHAAGFQDIESAIALAIGLD